MLLAQQLLFLSKHLPLHLPTFFHFLDLKFQQVLPDVLLAELDESKDSIVLKGSSGAEVTAIAATKSRSHLFIGDAKGQILWAPLKSQITSL